MTPKINLRAAARLLTRLYGFAGRAGGTRERDAADDRRRKDRVRAPRGQHGSNPSGCRDGWSEHIIEQLPEQYETKLGEGAQNLSGCQRQRIAIARAILTEAPFMVLDEPTSAFDPNNERLVTDALEELKDRRTIVLVTHRLSSVMRCDQIYVLDQGRMVEHGTYEQLLSRDGIFAAMARYRRRGGEIGLLASAA